MDKAGLAIVAVGVLMMGLSGVLPLSGLSEQQSCLAIYGIDPSVVQSQGSALTAQQYFNAQVSDPVFAGFGPWQGPAPLPANYLNPPATQGSQWAATLTGSPVAVLASNGFYTNPNGGPLASIAWENTIYSLGPGTYTYPGGQATLTKTTYYDLSSYLSGTCASVYNTPTATTTAVRTTTTTSSTTSTSTSTSSTSTSMTSTLASSTVSKQPIGASSPPAPPNYPVFFIGLALAGVGGAVTLRKKR